MEKKDVLNGFKPTQSFEEYCERFKDYYSIRREDGIIEIKMCRDGGPSPWTVQHNYGWGPLLQAVGDDPENEVIIIGGTGDRFFTSSQADGYARYVFELQRNDPQAFAELMFDTVQRVAKMIHTIAYSVDVPIIGVVNGPADSHMELAFLCDMALSAPNVEYKAIHFPLGMVPGDGFFMLMQKMLGNVRANYLAYTGKPFTAQEALEWGMVSEIHDSDKIYDRAWELARSIMEKPRAVRRLTHDLVRKPLREYVSHEYYYQDIAECLGGLCIAGKKSG